jgi:hypothetical protein
VTTPAPIDLLPTTTRDQLANWHDRTPRATAPYTTQWIRRHGTGTVNAPIARRLIDLDTELDRLRATLAELRHAHTHTLDTGQWEIAVTCTDPDCHHGHTCTHPKTHTHMWRSPWRPGGHYQPGTGGHCPDGTWSRHQWNGRHETTRPH